MHLIDTQLLHTTNKYPAYTYPKIISKRQINSFKIEYD